MAEAMTWQAAVAELAFEKTQAENGVRLLKRNGDKKTIAKGEILYGDAKAEYDAVIAGLVVALAGRGAPESLPNLEDRLNRGAEKREAFRALVEPLRPADAGHKNVVLVIAKVALGPLIKAVQDLYAKVRDEDAVARKTIQTQLEATVWPAFATVKANA